MCHAKEGHLNLLVRDESAQELKAKKSKIRETMRW